MSRPKIERLEDWTYQVEGLNEPVPSVTNIIKATVPKELAWWGMQVGIAGTLDILSREERTHSPAARRRVSSWTVDDIEEQMKYKKLTVNDTMKAAGARGTEVHDILEAYGKTGTLPETVSEAAAGYAKALGLFLLENQPVFFEQETMTASLEYKYAGTFDGKCVLQNGKFSGQRVLVDIKTSKRIYKDQHYPQLEAYEHSEIELGEEPTDIRMIVRLADTGKYQLSVSTDTFDDFYVLLKHYESIERRKAKGKRKKK